MVSVVKKATAGTISTPASTSVPTRGNAMKAGMRVIVPNIADAIVATRTLYVSTNSAIC